ncbi:hypothetical protein EDC04DRAFT_1615024 [Pisolithus marmoratus]|nr:hypothetical protein EDC04DRAFT_1615024 [Pisolithus marmoratus]
MGSRSVNKDSTTTTSKTTGPLGDPANRCTAGTAPLEFSPSSLRLLVYTVIGLVWANLILRGTIAKDTQNEAQPIILHTSIVIAVGCGGIVFLPFTPLPLDAECPVNRFLLRTIPLSGLAISALLFVVACGLDARSSFA